MTLNEFKAWLEGYEASFGATGPNEEQWATVKAKLADVRIVSDLPATVRVPFIPDTPATRPYRGPWWDEPRVRYGTGTDRAIEDNLIPRSVLLSTGPTDFEAMAGSNA